MIAWTLGGAVARPRTLQIRLQATHPDRLAARAPLPSRSLATEEVQANLDWFTASSPRGLPVDALVLSGAGVAARADLGTIVAHARARGVVRVTLHAGVDGLEEPDLPEGIDRVVLPVRRGGGAPGLAAAFARVRASAIAADANLPLGREDLAGLGAAGEGDRNRGAASLTFTYPFPGGEEPPTVEAAVARLASVVPSVLDAGVPLAIKGLPACWLGALAPAARRSQNRWYVDADRQLGAALLFFPDVVAFAKGDPCRFCARDAACDGPLAAWSGRADNPVLRPFEA